MESREEEERSISNHRSHVVFGIAETVSVSLDKYIELMKRGENIKK
jgi:hypothetical protein